jgi:hypothetical protein
LALLSALSIPQVAATGRALLCPAITFPLCSAIRTGFFNFWFGEFNIAHFSVLYFEFVRRSSLPANLVPVTSSVLLNAGG